MKKIITSLMAVVLVSIIVFVCPSYAENHESQTNVQLTETQKEELSKLHEEILAKKKELIDKYAEFGIITQEKKEKIKAHMDTRFLEMKENGFICHQKHCGHRGKGHHSHESDPENNNK
ncbi:hypothetical protein CVD28_14015 [Bacillus sp. M6-12]|uniref:YckD family protein n=1 Tax=Bacillus sp. M6-12 TaxID=2054166 RepID=UPI000C76153A|nr:YckD family protein [Bacillus sp. M6-12]PLS17165.1 hypothetical protein CVD28_14015 [Bacillus sp. M6-12]